MENLEKGSKTLWANIGAQQFHLPEGKPDAQVLKGEIRLCFPKSDLETLIQRYDANDFPEVLKDSHFDLTRPKGEKDTLTSANEIRITDPWGSKFQIVASQERVKDVRGTQGGDSSVGTCIEDITIYTSSNANIAGIARFYEQILDAPILDLDSNEKYGGGRCVVSMGPYQTLTFQSRNDIGIDTEEDGVNMHVDLRDEPESNPPDKKYYPSNYGPHISIYIRDIRSTYQRAQKLGIAYVNPRFKRRAYNEDEVVKDCMFRCLEIVDPENAEAGVILRLEHEVRNVLKVDGSIYNSCPFEEAPPDCVI